MKNSTSSSASRSHNAAAPASRLLPSGRLQQQDVRSTQIDPTFETRVEQKLQQQQVSNILRDGKKCKLFIEPAAQNKSLEPIHCERLASNQFEVSVHSSQVRKYEQSRRDCRGLAASTPQTRHKSTARKSTTGAAGDATRLNSIDYFGREESPLQAQNSADIRRAQMGDERLAPSRWLTQHSAGSLNCQGADMNCSPIEGSHFVPGANAVPLDKQQRHRAQPSINGAFANYQPRAQSASSTMATDSSGFSSAGSSSSSASVTSQNGAGKTSASLIRSQLLEDLARLEKIAAAAANRNKTQQPAGELNPLSMSPELGRQRAASLRPGTEFDYSTLCRDEFSSFIPNHEQQDDDLRRQRSASTTRDCATIDQRRKQKEQFGACFKSMHNLGPGQQRANDGASDCSSTRRKRRSERRRDRLAGGPSLVGVHEFETPPTPSFLQPQHHSAQSLASQPAHTSSASPSSSGSEESITPSSGSPACDSSLSHISNTATSFVRPLQDDNYESFHHIPGHDRVHFNGLLQHQGDSLEGRSSDDSELLDRELLFHERQMEDQDHDSDILRRETADRFEAQVEEFFSDESEIDCQEQVADFEPEAVEEPQEDEESVRIEDVEDPTFDPATRLVLCSNSGDHNSLSRTLDVYLERVESLLRLAKGDRSVGFEQAFGGGSEDEIQVSKEFKTEVGFVKSLQRDHLRPEVVQEIQMVEETDESDEAEDNSNMPLPLKSRRRRSVIVQRELLVDDYKSLSSSPHTSPQLNWWPNVAHEGDERLPRSAPQRFVGEREREQLEKAFTKSWLDEEAADLRGPQDDREIARLIRRHMGEFIENFNVYHAELLKRADFARDWRTNWLFRASSSIVASKRAYSSVESPREAEMGRTSGGECGSKRVKMSMLDYPANNYINIRSELLHYSTVIVANRRPLRVASCAAGLPTVDSAGSASNPTGEHIAQCYRDRPDYLEELEQVAGELSHEQQVDVCRLLLEDDFDEAEQEQAEHENERDEADKALEICYETSLIVGLLVSRGSLSFTAHGHSFALRKLFSRRAIACFDSPAAPMTSRTRAARERHMETIKRQLLVRLRDACSCPPSQLELMRRNAAHFKQLNYKRDRVKFLVPPHNLELTNQLPVILFCAKIAGALPIRVRWFRRDARQQGDHDDHATSGEFVEISDKATERSRDRDLAGAWPLTMEANFDYERPSSWASVWRFRRQLNHILFEIRRPSLKHDLNQTYKCVIQNYCSIEECQFELRLKREAPQKAARDIRQAQADEKSSCREEIFERVKLNKLAPDEKQEAGQAILRTWSQRTLKRPPNTMDEASMSQEADELVSPDGHSYHTQTVGRLSAKVASKLSNEFGTDYPYHPDCLRRRLEENKLSLSLRSGTIMRYQRVSRPTETRDEDKFAPADVLASDGRQELFNSSPSPPPRASRSDNKENEIGDDQGFIEKMSQEVGHQAADRPEPRPRSRQRLAEASEQPELERQTFSLIRDDQPIKSGNVRQKSQEMTGVERSQPSAPFAAAQSTGEASNQNHSPPRDRAHLACEQRQPPRPSQCSKPTPPAKSSRLVAANESARNCETVPRGEQPASQSKASAEIRPARSAVRSLISRFNNNN